MMTPERIKILNEFVNSSKSLLGDMTMLKQRIAWLEGEVPIKVSARYAGNDNELAVYDSVLSAIRVVILTHSKVRLADLEKQFLELEIPNV